MKDQSGEMIRSLLQSGAKNFIAAPPGKFDAALAIYNKMGENSAKCYFRNLRGECANPNMKGEYGMMSWDEYDRRKAAGTLPASGSDSRKPPFGSGQTSNWR